MKVFKPHIETSDGIVSITVNYELDQPFGAELHNQLGFSFPESYLSFVSETMEAYVLGLLFLAMKTKETMYVEGILSPQFLLYMTEYQKYFVFFSKGELAQIDIIPTEIKEDKKETTKQTIATFSGGVDSFYTLSKNKESKPTGIYERSITHATFIKGFDFFLPQHEGNYERIFPLYHKMLQEEYQVDLIPVETNFRHVIEHFSVYPWEAVHGAALGMIGLLFSKGFDTYYIASSDGYDTLIDGWGSHPIPDTLMTTESFHVIHDALEASRYDKTVYLAHISQTYDHLRVCWEKPDGVQNCGKCSKCVQVMMYLETEDQLNNYTTFPKELDLKLVENYHISKNDPFFHRFASDFATLSRQKGKVKLAQALEKALA
ncbi:MAG: hypothetical protein AB8B61_08925 [Cyclobacteriaceae bacterium]